MKKIGKIEKSVAALLVAVMMLSSLLPTTALAATPGASEPVAAYQTADTSNTSEGKIVKEIVEKRDKNTKHFLKDDGTYEAVIYPNPVHYLDNGVWQDIDNSLSEVDTADGTGNKVLSTKQNDFQVNIAKNADSKKLVSITKGKYEIEWNIDNGNSAGVSVDAIDEIALNNQIEQEVATKLANEQDPEKKAKIEPVLIENEKIKTLKNVSSAVTFNNVFTDIDLQYVINSNKVKENIIINQPSTVNELSFNLKAKNLTPKVQEDNSIIFYDDKDLSKGVFKM